MAKTKKLSKGKKLEKKQTLSKATNVLAQGQDQTISQGQN